jgi:hypothetical protein
VEGLDWRPRLENLSVIRLRTDMAARGGVVDGKIARWSGGRASDMCGTRQDG